MIDPFFGSRMKSAGGEVTGMVESRRSVGFVVTEVALQMGLIVRTAGTQALEVRMSASERQIIAQVATHREGSKLKEMPGTGSFVAAVLVAELLPLARHSSEAQAATYSGAMPLSRSSGEQSRSDLARRTNKRIERALFLSALASIKVSAIDRAYYRRKRQDFEGHPKPHV